MGWYDWVLGSERWLAAPEPVAAGLRRAGWAEVCERPEHPLQQRPDSVLREAGSVYRVIPTVKVWHGFGLRHGFACWAWMKEHGADGNRERT